MDEKQILQKLSERELLIEPKALALLAQSSEAEHVLEHAIKSASGFVITTGEVEAAIAAISAENKVAEVHVSRGTNYDPPARSVQAKLKFRDDLDISGKSRCTGTVQDFVAYFRDRYKRLSGILRNRAGEAPVTKINKLGEFVGQRNVRIIGIVMERRDSKNGHLLLELEDDEGRITALVGKDSPLMKDAKNILHDEVIAVDGYVSNGLFIVKAFYVPDIPFHEKRFADENVSAALISDLHIGSKYFLQKPFERFLEFLNGDTDEKEIAGNIKYLVIAGDIVDGIGVYPTQEKHLVTKDIYVQYEIFCEFVKKIPEHIEVVVSPGNHDAVRNAEPQPRLLPEFVTDLKGYSNVHFVGSPSFFEMHGVRTLIYHGTSADSLIAGLSIEGGYQQPEKVAIEMMKRRHLSPLYGERAIVPEQRDYLVIDEVPDLFHFGHVHKNGYADYRGTKIVNSGTWQDTTDYQLKQGHIPSPCELPIVNLSNQSMKVLKFL